MAVGTSENGLTGTAVAVLYAVPWIIDTHQRIQQNKKLSLLPVKASPPLRLAPGQHCCCCNLAPPPPPKLLPAAAANTAGSRTWLLLLLLPLLHLCRCSCRAACVRVCVPCVPRRRPAPTQSPPGNTCVCLTFPLMPCHGLFNPGRRHNTDRTIRIPGPEQQQGERQPWHRYCQTCKTQ